MYALNEKKCDLLRKAKGDFLKKIQKKNGEKGLKTLAFFTRVCYNVDT